MPRALYGFGGLGGGAEIHVGPPNPDLCRAIKLASGIYRPVSVQHHLGPGAIAAWGVGEELGIEVGKIKIAEKLHRAGLSRRARHLGIGGYSVGRSDLGHTGRGVFLRQRRQSSDGNQAEKTGDPAGMREAGHWTSPLSTHAKGAALKIRQ